ncbi:MAG: flippase-like domain-containing protein [Chitinophagaceae bacterium]|nr:flippase-like domain-containing protein [Chitinophagaceae bacterium]
MSKRFKTVLQYIIFLGFGLFLAWWSLKDLTADDKSQIRSALKGARYWLVAPVFLILVLSHYVRAIRWRLLIESLGHHTTKTNAFFAVFIGYLANQAVPRLGEILKCTFLARYEKVPADKLIGTIILERIIDALCLLIVFGITLIIQPDIYGKLIDAIFAGNNKPGDGKGISSALITLIVAGAVIIIIVIWMIKNKKTFADLGLALKKIGQRIWNGVSAVQHLKKRGQFIAYTLLLWGLYLSGGYLGFLAFQQTGHYGIQEAFTILSAGSIGMIVSPGGIGAYAYIIEKTMQVYGLNKGIALAFGWILWLAQTTVIVLGGIISFVSIPYYNKKRKK